MRANRYTVVGHAGARWRPRSRPWAATVERERKNPKLGSRARVVERAFEALEGTYRIESVLKSLYVDLRESRVNLFDRSQSGDLGTRDLRLEFRNLHQAGCSVVVKPAAASTDSCDFRNILRLNNESG